MKIIFHRKFKKFFNKLEPHIQEKVRETIFKFSQNPHDPTLRNHALSGKLLGYRAISVTGDIRIIFIEEKNNLQATMTSVGTHNQIYE